MNGGLPQEFLERMKAQLKDEERFSAFLSSYDRPTQKGLRVNTLKLSVEDFKAISPFSLQKISWEKSGFYVTEEKIGAHPYHFAGLYYSQEPSAMSVVPLLEVEKGERVLDLCAAPGGKSTQIAQALQGEGLLVCNEIMPDRAAILSQNIERLGVKNAVVTNAKPDFLERRFPLYFDKILVDAPCSGEGMFKKNEKEALVNWSKENVLLCAKRQKEILSCAANMLKGGGRLVYSTCTFAKEEDEEQVQDFLNTHPDFRLIESKKLYPHEVAGEGHFYAVFEKSGSENLPLKEERDNLSAKEKALVLDFLKSVDLEVPTGVLYRTDKAVYLLPQNCFSLQGLPVLRAGIRLGEFLKDRFEPNHAFAITLKSGEVKRVVNVSVEESEKYLRGETLDCAIENGWCLVCVNSYPLGWGKATGGVVKNHFPKGLRKMSR